MASDCSFVFVKFKAEWFRCRCGEVRAATPGQCKYNSSPMNDTQVSTWKVLCSSCIYQTVQKEKDPVFTGVSSQHINTTINLQSIFILCFHLIFNCFLIISVELSSRHSLFVVIMVQECKSWDGLKVDVAQTTRNNWEVGCCCGKTQCLHSLNLLGVHHTQVPRREQI